MQAFKELHGRSAAVSWPSTPAQASTSTAIPASGGTPAMQVSSWVQVLAPCCWSICSSRIAELRQAHQACVASDSSLLDCSAWVLLGCCHWVTWPMLHQ